MRGSVKKRGRTYTYVVDIGSDPLTGKRRQRTKGGFRTRKECLQALRRRFAPFGKRSASAITGRASIPADLQAPRVSGR